MPARYTAPMPAGKRSILGHLGGFVASVLGFFVGGFATGGSIFLLAEYAMPAAMSSRRATGATMVSLSVFAVFLALWRVRDEPLLFLQGALVGVAAWGVLFVLVGTAMLVGFL